MATRDEKIDESLARIGADARRLARLARARGSPRGDPYEAARHLRALRAKRDEILPAALFGDPAWDMLLVLFRAHDEQSELSMTALFEAAGMASATGLPWLDRLEAGRLVAKRTAPNDRRVKLYSLTGQGAERMSRLLKGF